MEDKNVESKMGERSEDECVLDCFYKCLDNYKALVAVGNAIEYNLLDLYEVDAMREVVEKLLKQRNPRL